MAGHLPTGRLIDPQRLSLTTATERPRSTDLASSVRTALDGDRRCDSDLNRRPELDDGCAALVEVSGSLRRSVRCILSGGHARPMSGRAVFEEVLSRQGCEVFPS